MNITTRDNILPLTPQALQVLIALSLTRANGYEIMRQVQTDTSNTLQILPGSLYPLLKRLHRANIIEEAYITSPRPGRPSLTYKLTSLGRQILEWELDRLEQAAKLGRERLSQARKPARS